MRTIWMVLTLCALLVAAGCKNQTTTSSSSTESTSAVAQTNLTPEELGELGAQIQKQPSEAKALLSKHGMSEESFEQAIRKVSEDPKASKEYTEAYKRASA